MSNYGSSISIHSSSSNSNSNSNNNYPRIWNFRANFKNNTYSSSSRDPLARNRWYNGNALRPINANVIRNPITLNNVTVRTLPMRYIDVNGTRHLYTLNQLRAFRKDPNTKAPINPLTGKGMRPRRLPKDIEQAIKRFLERQRANRTNAFMKSMGPDRRAALTGAAKSLQRIRRKRRREAKIVDLTRSRVPSFKNSIVHSGRISQPRAEKFLPSNVRLGDLVYLGSNRPENGIYMKVNNGRLVRVGNSLSVNALSKNYGLGHVKYGKVKGNLNKMFGIKS